MKPTVRNLSRARRIADLFRSAMFLLPRPLRVGAALDETGLGALVALLTVGLPLTGCAQEQPPRAGAPGDGLRVAHIGLVAPDVIGVTILAGRSAYGDQVPYGQQPGDKIDRQGHQRWVHRGGRYLGSLVGKEEKLLYTPDRVVGDPLEPRWVDNVDSYRVSSRDDATFGDAQAPATVHRKTKPTDLCRVGPWQFESPTESVVYLKLASPLTVGKTYTVSFKGEDVAPQTFTHDPTKLRSEAVHVSHLGFHPRDPVKVAFLSCWAGSGGALGYREAMVFQVIDQKTGRVVHEGATKLSKSKDDLTEDAYKRNYNGCDVYEMDFSEVTDPGTFVVSVQDIGCSYPFRIDADAWRDGFYVSARGFYHQRSGIELGPPYTDFKRPRTFHPDDGVRIFASTAALMDTGNGLNKEDSNFGELNKGKTDEVVPNAWGGYMDAGDWDRRIQHLIASLYLIELAELFPDYFAQVNLNIPESNKGLPDVVSEALFNLDCYRRMQTPEGGIRGGIESSEHPREGECSWQESLDVMAYAPGVWSSYWYAATAARAANWLADRKPELAKVYRDSAVRAAEWAERELPELGEIEEREGGVRDLRNLAAAELFRLTGEGRWNEVFLATTAFADPGANLYKWPTHKQRDNAWVYARTEHAGTDEAVRQNCRNAILREANARAAQCEKTAFHWTKDPWMPPAWSAFSAPYAVSLCRAHALTGDAKYLRAAVLACQHGAGANPLNLCYTTGLGHKSPLHPLHIDSRCTDQSPPPGLTVFGPIGFEQGKDQWAQKLVNKNLYPAFEKWPTTEAYWDVFWYPMMCEFTVQQPMARNAYAWGYLAAAARP